MTKLFSTILFVLLFSFQVLAQDTHVSIDVTTLKTPTKVYGNGFLEYEGEVPVLHLKGSEFEMGKQYGFMAGDRIQANIENLKTIGESQVPQVKYLPNSVFTWLRKIVGFAFYVYFPSEVQEHIDGIIAGAKENGIKLSRYDIAFTNSVIDIVGIGAAIAKKGGIGDKEIEQKLLKIFGIEKFLQNCDSMAAWGPRTVDGKTFQTRNTDITTGAGIERYPIIIIYKTEGKIPFITATFSGMVGIFTGMNAYGVGLGQVWAFSDDVKLGTPWNISLRKFFAESKTAGEIVASMQAMKETTYGNNFVIADAGGHDDAADTGFAVEMTAKKFAYFTQDDARELEVKYEGVSYGYPIANAVYRGDLALDPTIRSHQRAANGPDGNPREAGSYINRYKGQYDKIADFESKNVLIGQREAEYISRETAMKNSSLQTAVYANTDRDMWVSYAKIQDDGTVLQAYDRPYVNYPFYSYLSDLVNDNGEVKIHNWFKARNKLLLVHRQANRHTALSINVASDATVATGITLAHGESVELYDNGKFIDVVKGL